MIEQQITIQARGKTDVGKIRTSNQDNYLIDNNKNLFIIADGMGGHAGGEIASRLCIDLITEFLDNRSDVFKEAKRSPHPNSKISNSLIQAVNHASQKIYEKALENPDLKGMGTTATAVKIVDDYAYCAHVGDSRLYLIRCGFCYQITADHSLINEQIKAGLLTHAEAEVHHLRNVITRSVGYQEEEDVDSCCLKLEDGDYLLLCSDGLHAKVTDAEFSNFIKTANLQSVENLVDLANYRGGEDNISVIIIKIQVFSQTSRTSS